MGKFDKKIACKYCEEEMDAKYRNKRFCSDKCRVYWNRENKEKKIEKPPEIKKESSPESKKLTFWEQMRNKRLGM